MSIDGARWAGRHSESLVGFWGTLEGTLYALDLCPVL